MTAALAAIGALLLALAGLAGWLFDNPLLRTGLPRAITMKLNTSVALAVAALALLALLACRGSRRARWAQPAAQLGGLAVALVGLATLASHAWFWSPGIDRLFYPLVAAAPAQLPARMTPLSAGALAAIGLAIALVPYHRPRHLAWLLAAAAVLAGAWGLLSFGWRLESLLAGSVLRPMAVHTALALVLLGIATAGVVAASHRVWTGLASRRYSIELKVAGGFAAAMLLLCIGGVTTYQASVAFAASSDTIARTHAARTELGRMFSQLSQAESAARAYALTAHADLKPQFAGFADAVRSGIAARESLVDDGSTRQSLRRIEALAGLRLESLERLIALRDDPSFSEAAAAEATTEGTAMMDRLRAMFQELDAWESAQLANSMQRADAERDSAVFFLLLTLIVSGTVFGSLFANVRREMLARRRNEQEIQALNADLERRIGLRTAALEANQRQFVALFEFSPDALVMTNPQGRMVQVNRRAEALFGWSRAQIIGQNVEMLMAAQTRAAHVALRASFLQTATQRAMGNGRNKLRGLRKDGTEFPIDIGLSPFELDGQTIVVAAIRDTTEREQLMMSLQRSSALYMHTLEGMLEGCQIIGFDWCYQYVNPAAARQRRIPAERFIGAHVLEVFPQGESHPGFAAMQTCMDQRVAQQLEYMLEFDDGSPCWLEISVLPAPEGIALFSVDITERKQAEDRLRASHAELERRVAERTAELVQAREAADAANRAKSAFLATMSHEIRTPMNGVIGMVEILSHTKMAAHQSDAVRTIRNSAFALLRLIDDILDFSKIEAGRLELEQAELNLTELIESVCSTLLPVAAEKGVDLHLFIDPRLPQRIRSDPTRLRQVLFNIAGNAIKFSGGRAEQRGQVEVRAICCAGDPARMQIRVADNGVGIEPEALDRLFESFSQAESSTTRRFGGTGLGLAISRRLVTLMHGEIAVQSEPQRGSTFHITLPLDAVTAAPPAGDSLLRGLTCIIVGDLVDPPDLRTYLEHAGADVRLADSLEDVARLAAGQLRPVIVHNRRRVHADLASLRTLFPEAVDARHLLLQRGRRASARASARDVLALDANLLRRSALLRAVAAAAGRASPELLQAGADDLHVETVVEPPTVAQARAQGRLILVAEDDEVNRKVILRQIGLLGHAAEIAENGAEALQLWRNGHYALLLTDLHMPDMDGYALAEAIRAQELEDGVPQAARMPILALTANALRGEARRAQAAGMDEYLTKPVQLGKLKGALQKWMPAEAPDSGFAETAAEPAPTAASGHLDIGILRQLVGDDPEMVRELLSLFCDSAIQSANDLRAASLEHDFEQLGRHAHKLKASARTIGATMLGDLCSDLENACRAGTADGTAGLTQSALGELHQVLGLVRTRLRPAAEPTTPHGATKGAP